MFCSNCRNLNDDNLTTCKFCGSPLRTINFEDVVIEENKEELPKPIKKEKNSNNLEYIIISVLLIIDIILLILVLMNYVF